jgi:hypothetical protein
MTGRLHPEQSPVSRPIASSLVPFATQAQALENRPFWHALPAGLSHPPEAVHPDQLRAQTEKEKQPWQELCALLRRRFVHAAHVQQYAPAAHDHHWGKLARTFLTPEIKTALFRTA